MNVEPDAEALAAQFGDLLEHMPDAIVLVNAAGQIVLTTALAEALFGYARGELRGRLVEELLPTRFRSNHAGLRTNYVAQSRNRTMGAGLELFGQRKDRTEFPVEISLSPFNAGKGLLVLTAVRDITERKRTEKALQDLSNENAMLLREMQHRIANSLQIVASILSLKASSVQSDEARLSLGEAHQRILSIAAVQSHLLKAGGGDVIQVALYMEELCGNLASSIVGEKRPITLTVKANGGDTGSMQAVSLGLIVTELVMNAIKYAFPGKEQTGRIVVSYETSNGGWKLNVADDGVGYPGQVLAQRRGGGLGTNLVKALARQLSAQVEVTTGPKGTSVSVAHHKAGALGIMANSPAFGGLAGKSATA